MTVPTDKLEKDSALSMMVFFAILASLQIIIVELVAKVAKRIRSTGIMIFPLIPFSLLITGTSFAYSIL